MLYMTFTSFLTLLIISLVVTLLKYYVFKKKLADGICGFFYGWVLGWLGGWLGTPVFGKWGGMYGKICIIPAIIGSFALLSLFYHWFKK